MARRTITMTEQVETIYHWHAGQGLRTIVKSLGISRNTVRKYVRLAKQAGLRRGEPLPSRERLVDILYIPGPQPASSGPATSQLSPFHAQLEAWFKEKDMAQTQNGEIGTLEFLHLILQDEIERRAATAAAQRIQKAVFQEEKTLEGFDFGALPKLKPSLIRDLATCTFIDRRESVTGNGPICSWTRPTSSSVKAAGWSASPL